MKITDISFLQKSGKSFAVYKETDPFSQWHHHSEYELVLITKGRGRLMVGDQITRFKENDLIFIGSYTLHEWLFDPVYFDNSDGSKGEGIVVQFLSDFLGEKFFNIPENTNLKKFLSGSSKGYKFYGISKKRITAILLKIMYLSDFDRLQALFSIFKIFAVTKDFTSLSSSSFLNKHYLNKNKSMPIAMKFILQNFQKQIMIKDLLNVTNMSTSSFCTSFKNSYRMSFKAYLLNLRVVYACKLLTDSSQSISRTAYASGFDNISNFNRQFKKIKGITPSKFRYEINSIEKL